MKILIVVQRYYPSIGGSQKLAQDLAEELVKVGHEVTVATTDSMSQQDVVGFSFTKGIKWSSSNNNLSHHQLINGVNVHRFKPLFQIMTYMFNPKMFFWLKRNVDKYDVVHAFCYMFAEPDMVSMLRNKRSKWKFIIEPNDIKIPDNANQLYKAFKYIYDKTIGNFTLSKADKIIMLTDEGIKQLKKIYVPKNNQVIAIQPGIHIPLIDKKIKRIKNRLLFVGRFVEYKGAQYVLHAIKLLIESGVRDVSGVFVGTDQGYLLTLKKITHDLGIEQNVTFKEDLPDALLFKEYQQAEFFALPSTNEGFGIVALVAASYGVIPILLNSGGLKKIVAEAGGILLNPNDDIPKSIAKAVESLQTGKIVIDASRISKFLWKSLIKKYEKTYK